MSYRVDFSRQALKDLKKMDPHIVRLILFWIEKNLERTVEPRQYGESLTGNYEGSWRYRVGDYRILARIEQERLVILVVHVGHRKHVYR